MSHISVVEFLILTLTGLISVQLIRANDLPILHSGCNENEDASQPTHLAYPNDCTRFYKCSGGYAFPMNCPKGLHWSVKHNYCEYPAEAGCAVSDGNQMLLTTTKSSSEDDSNGIIVLNCPAEENPNQPTHLPYPGDCSKFFKCIIGKSYPLNCPLGLHWSVELNRCEWPDVAKCSKNNTTRITESNSELAATTAPTTSSTTLPTTSPTKSPTPASTLSTKALNFLCKNTASDLLSYPGNCMRYIRCSNGVGRIQFCPGNLLFDSRVGVCSRTCA